MSWPEAVVIASALLLIGFLSWLTYKLIYERNQ